MVEDFERDAPEDVLRGERGWYRTSRGHQGISLATRIDEGAHYGGNGHVELSELGVFGAEELYYRYWLWFDAGFEIEPPARGKLPGPAGLWNLNCYGGRPTTPTRPCFSARMQFSRQYSQFGDPDHPSSGPDDRTLLGYYVYDLDSPEGRGSSEDWDEDVALLQHDRWYCVEGRVRMNTLGSSDGVLQGWVDGRLAFDDRDRTFRRPDEPQIDVKSMWLNVYYGGQYVSPRDNYVKLDSLALGPTKLGCDDRPVGAGPFTDLGDSVHVDDVDWFTDVGLTRGCDPPDNTLFCPQRPVTRGEFATFLTRALSLPRDDTDRFVDDDTSPHEAAIQALAAAGITEGCNPPHRDEFCPDDPVSRAQMAALLKRAFELPRVDADPFRDDDDSIFERDIEALAAANITRGCDPPENTRFCPDQPVTREQLASFLRRAATRT